MPLFSIILLFWAAYHLCCCKSIRRTYLYLFFTTAAIDMLCLQGYFISFGAKQWPCSYFLLIVTSFYACYAAYAYRRQMNWNVFGWSALFILAIALSITYEVLFPYDGLVLGPQAGDDEMVWDSLAAGKNTFGPAKVQSEYTMGIFRQYAAYAWNIFVAKNLLTRDDVLWGIDRLLIVAKVAVIYGFAEFFCLNILGNTSLPYAFIHLFLGKSDWTAHNEAVLRGDMYSLNGFAPEPSYFVMSLCTMALLAIVRRKINQVNPQETPPEKWQDKLLVPGIILLMALSGGFSGVWSILVILGAAIYMHWDIYRSGKISLLIKGAAGVALLTGLAAAVSMMLSDTSYIGGRLTEAMELAGGFAGSGGMDIVRDSTAIRMFGIYWTGGDFLARPLLGLGLGVEYCNSTTITLLADIGIIGVWAWFKMVTAKKEPSMRYDGAFILLFILIRSLPMESIPMHSADFAHILLIEGTAIYMSCKAR